MSIRLLPFTGIRMVKCRMANDGWREGKRAKSRSSNLELVKCSRATRTRTSGWQAQSLLRRPPLWGHDSLSLPLANTYYSSSLRDRLLHRHPHPRHRHPPPPSHAHLRDPPTRPSHCSRIVTTTVLARPATILGPHASAPASASHPRARSPRLENHQLLQGPWTN